MKTVELRGGLGNQLFQLAFAHSIRRLVGEPVAVAPRNSAPVVGAEMVTLADRLGLRFVPGLDRSPPASVKQSARSVTNKTFERLIESGSYFRGYWQHPSYILEPDAIRSVVRTFLGERCGEGQGCDVALHFRSYSDEPLPWRRGVPPKDYFARALSRTPSPEEPPRLVSDRPDLARRRLGRAVAGAFDVQGSASEHLAALLSARRLVLANSSFSWWAGFCGRARTAIYPRRYNCFHYPAPAAEFIVL